MIGQKTKEEYHGEVITLCFDGYKTVDTFKHNQLLSSNRYNNEGLLYVRTIYDLKILTGKQRTVLNNQQKSIN